MALSISASARRCQLQAHIIVDRGSRQSREALCELPRVLWLLETVSESPLPRHTSRLFQLPCLLHHSLNNSLDGHGFERLPSGKSSRNRPAITMTPPSLDDYVAPIRCTADTAHQLSHELYRTFQRLSAESLDQFLPTPIAESILRPAGGHPKGR